MIFFKKVVSVFFDTHEYLFLTLGGKNILIKLEKTVFRDINGNIDIEGKFINSYMTYTSSGRPFYTQMVLAWDSQIYKSVQKVKMRNYLKIAKVVATFILSVELIIAMYGRYTRKTKSRMDQKI